jgi:uncharacterized protein YndB with AHSA1/START domain
MEAQPVVHSTFVIERSYPKPAEKVFDAFSDPAKKRRWFAVGENHDIETYEQDFRVGGVERYQARMTQSSPFPGFVLASETSYLGIETNRRIVSASTMSFGGKVISAALVTIELVESAEGTDLICTHQGAFFEGADGPQMREQGWRKLFEQLGQELAR